MKLTFFSKLTLLIFLISGFSNAQEMRFAVEKKCFTTSQGLDFKCKSEKQEFTITKTKKGFVGINPSGTIYNLKVVEDGEYITVLDNPVGFDGTSTIHITHKDRMFFWVEVAYSTILKSRELTVKSGRRIK